MKNKNKELLKIIKKASKAYNQPLPLNYELLQESGGHLKVSLVRSTFYQTNQYQCLFFYKPISQITNFNSLLNERT